MTVLVLALLGVLVGHWLREAWERHQDRLLLRAFPPAHGIASTEAPTTCEITAGVSLPDLWGDGVTPDPTRWRQP